MSNHSYVQKGLITMKVYMDNNATTCMTQEVVDAMVPYFIQTYGNASSKFYEVGRNAEAALADMRKRVAACIGASKENEIYFTGSGCEADNWAIKGVAFANKSRGNHIITSKIEHHAILNTCEYLQKHGFEVTYLDVDEYGFVKPEEVEAAIKDNTILISIMTANNEIGVIEPIKEIAAIAKKHKVIFHTDAVQAIGHMKINVQELGIDMLSLSAHKFHGPKGVGMLYIRNGIKIDNLIHGGGQERGKRAATENLAGIAGLTKALEIACENLDKNIEIMTKKRDKLINGILDTIPYTILNGPKGEGRLCNNANFSFRFIEGESILMMLDMEGICVSTGSACTSGSLEPSYVLEAMGVPQEIANGTIRFSVSKATTKEDIDYTVEKLIKVVEKLRAISPISLKGGK